MKLPRRRFLHLAAGAAALPAVSRIARAQAYPSRPVRIIVGFAAGGAGRHHRTPDGSMAVGAARPAIRHRKPAGCCHQYRRRGGREVAARWLYAPPRRFGKRNQRNALRKAQFQFHPRHRAGRRHRRVPCVMEVNPSVPAKTVPEFIAYAKANPGKLSMASGGIGTAVHMSGELFKMMTGVNIVHVPYRGGGARAY